MFEGITAMDIFWVVFIWVFGSFTAGFIETWWEQRKRDKENKKWS